MDFKSVLFRSIFFSSKSNYRDNKSNCKAAKITSVSAAVAEFIMLQRKSQALFKGNY